MKTQGKLIVIDGTDGAGKATQTKLLVRHLQRAGYPVSLVDFPRYGNKSAALVEEYLNGKLGTAQEVGPYRSSIFFAVDRFAASNGVRRLLARGRIVIANRYVSASMGHQGGMLANHVQRRAFLRWLDHLEFGIFGIPRPDLTIILHVPARVAQKLVDKKRPRAYIHGKKRDLYEGDLAHLRTAEASFLDLPRMFKEMRLIECMYMHTLLTPKEVHEKIWNIVTPTL